MSRRAQRRTLRQLNELLVEVLQRRASDGVLWLPDPPAPVDPAPDKPWLPDTYWADVARRTARAAEDAKLAQTVTVESVLEEGLEPLVGDDERLGNWGRLPMTRSGGIRRPLMYANADPQPKFPFECYQCGRPITADGRDHGGRTLCDLTFVDEVDIDTDSYWTDHQPKPWKGEEMHDDEDGEDAQ